MLRGPSPTLKIVFSPRRVMVLSLKVSSLRDWTPVCTAVPWRTSSFTAAGRADAFDGSTRTSWMTWVTLASFSSSALTSLRMPLASAKASAATVKVDRSWRCIVPLYSGFLAGLPKSRVFYGPSSPLLAHRRRSSEDVSDGAIEAAWGAVRAGNAEVAAGATHYACPEG